MLTIAVGDIHGQRALLDDLLKQTDRRRAAGPCRLVFLGDSIDRGPDSAGVIATLRHVQASAAPGDVICLRGNHEDMLLRARRDRSDEAHWLGNGGDTCLDSFGVCVARNLPDDVVGWIEACPTFFEDEWRCYVHAGLDPARERHDQTDDDRLWIREPFLRSTRDFGRFVVHGHTPQRSGRPDIRTNRVNLDTAAAYGGPLTAALFVDGQGSPVEFLQAFP